MSKPKKIKLTPKHKKSVEKALPDIHAAVNKALEDAGLDDCKLLSFKIGKFEKIADKEKPLTIADASAFILPDGCRINDDGTITC